MNESQQIRTSAPYEDEIDLRELFRVLWAGKWLIGGIAIDLASIALIGVLLLPIIHRTKAEHPFLILKRIFGFSKVRYRGLDKNANRLFVACGLVNLYMARRRLLRST